MSRACPQCLLPIFDGASGYAGPMCKCWARFAPNTDPLAVRCVEANPLTEADVRRIVREELARATISTKEEQA